MKKVILSMLLVVVGCIAAMAGNSIKLTEGSIASLKNGGVGWVVIDMADTKFDNKMPLRQDDRFKDVDSQMDNYKSEFVREFNDNTGKFKMTNNADEAQYEFIVKLTNLDVFVRLGSFKGGVGIKLWGNINIKDKTSGESVAVFTIDEEENSSMTYSLALEEGLEGIAKFLAKKIKKGK